MRNIDNRLVGAIRNGGLEEVKRYLNEGADPNFVIDEYDFFDYVSKIAK